MALLADGYAHNSIGRAATRRADSALPGSGNAAGGPIVDFAARPPRSSSPPAGTVALTFDDGPDPHWTPQILHVLARYGVHATFFVVGAKAAAHPGLLRAVRDAGHEIGSHTFTHTNLAAVSAGRQRIELSLTQTALAGAVGVHTSLLRLPYSSTAADLTSEDVAAARRAAAEGYLVVAATRDPHDWQRPGVDRIVALATPPGNDGAVILLHDSGGDRSQTIAALDRIIGDLARRGDHFVTVSELFGAHRAAVNPPVTGAERLRGWALLTALSVAHTIALVLTFLLIPIGVLALSRAVIIVAFAARHVRRSTAVPTGTEPFVSVVVPAFNEALTIDAVVRSLVDTTYRAPEVIVIDDGSTDGTADIVEGLALPGVRVVRQPNSGKAVALNTGLAASTADVVVMVDGDTLFEPTTLRELVAPLADPRVGAVSGNTKVGNRHGLLGRWQHIEDVLGFNLGRRMFGILRCMPTIPGAIGAFRRSALNAVGGVSTDTLAEDTDLTMAIHRAGYRVVYAERARAWTEAPASLGALWRQRYRWSYGTMQAMWKHRGAVVEGTRLGRIGLPYVLAFQILLPLLAPAVDLVTLYGLLFLDARTTLVYWLAFNLLNLGVGAFAFRLDGEPLSPLWAVLVQQFVYRQLMYLVVVQSMWSAIAGQRLPWHRVARTGTARAGTR